jgi:hypothetical protein
MKIYITLDPVFEINCDDITEVFNPSWNISLESVSVNAYTYIFNVLLLSLKIINVTLT